MTVRLVQHLAWVHALRSMGKRRIQRFIPQLPEDQDVARWLASVGINVEAKAGTAPVVLEGGVSLTLRPTDDVADEPSYILIIPQRLVTLEADKLTNSLRDASEARPTPIEEMKKQLFEKLRQLNQPRPKPESP